MTTRLWCAVIAGAVAGGCATPSTTPDLSVPYEQREIQGDKSSNERAQIHTHLAMLYYAGRNYAVALEESNKALQENSSYVPALNMLGLTYTELGVNSAAQQAFERAVAINPNDSDTRNNYGWFLCRTKREDEGIKQFMQAVRNPLYQTPEKAFNNAGDCARSKGDLAAADGYYSQALKAKPNFGRALLGMADVNYQRGDYKEARSQLDRYAQANAPTAESLWLTVRVHRKIGDRQSEVEAVRQLRRSFPDSPQAQLLQSGKFD